MTERGAEGDRVEFVPEALRGAGPSSFLDAEAMRRRAEASARERRLKLAAYGVDPDIAEAAVRTEQEKDAARYPWSRAARWQWRRFRVWLRDRRKAR